MKVVVCEICWNFKFINSIYLSIEIIQIVRKITSLLYRIKLEVNTLKKSH